MTGVVTLLIFCQALGATIGACTAVWSEIAYVRAVRDGRIDHAEREHLRIIGRGLRFGMSLLLLSSLGLVIVAYQLQGMPPPVLTPAYWILMVLALLVIGASWALSRRRISFAFGSAIAFTAWWFILFLTFGQLSISSFGAGVAFFVVAVAIFFAILYVSRLLVISGPRRGL